MRKMTWALATIVMLSLSGCGYNTFQTTDEQIKAAWAEVVNQYQRRADLIPNLVNTVKGFAEQEKAVLLGVTNARAKVGSIQATPELLNNQQAFSNFQKAQGELSGALSRLLVVTENYPQLKSDANFRDLQAQLEGTENRIAVARRSRSGTDISTAFRPGKRGISCTRPFFCDEGTMIVACCPFRFVQTG